MSNSANIWSFVVIVYGVSGERPFESMISLTRRAESALKSTLPEPLEWIGALLPMRIIVLTAMLGLSTKSRYIVLSPSMTTRHAPTFSVFASILRKGLAMLRSTRLPLTESLNLQIFHVSA
ncbi:MAG: hypothetical protein BWY81_00041 [Firmicutes bacterium ADurb.Bin467]|nr:MAG: hypothetical protein BWY81_00041 [Firmicutes bacterium ADurb.Bin467]